VTLSDSEVFKGLERYKDTQVKAYDITELIAELKSDNVYSTDMKYITLLLVFVS